MGKYKFTILPADKVFFTSDMHLGHFNICRYCNRPYSSRAEMDEALIANWNEVVPKDGIVINCGDFLFGNKERTDIPKVIAEYNKFADRLNGHMILVRGNHDIIPTLTREQNAGHTILEVVDKAYITFTDESDRIVASHEPLKCYPYEYNVYGHVHTLSDGIVHGSDAKYCTDMRPDQYDVGVDQNNYRPISWAELKEIFNRRKTNG